MYGNESRPRSRTSVRCGRKRLWGVSGEEKKDRKIKGDMKKNFTKKRKYEEGLMKVQIQIQRSGRWTGR